MPKPKVLFAASEVYPFAKSGGLADVAYSLPRALHSTYDIDVVMPLYTSINREKFVIESLDEYFEIEMDGVLYPVEIYGCKYEGISYRFVYAPLLCEREFLYGPPECGYEDNALRFGLFNYAIVAMLQKNNYEIAHLNDWQSALVPLLLNENKTIKTKSVFTIHNLAYQGVFDFFYLQKIGLDEKYFILDALEFYSQINFMKAGIAYADVVTTVSPKYAKEILTPAFGCGLEGFLKLHEKKLSGILNGIDTDHFAPPFNEIKGKAVSKKAYLKEAGLKGVSKPLFVFVSRFTWQKGMDLLIEMLPKLALAECNIAILGEGEELYHSKLKAIANENANVHLSFGYDEALSHRMYAAADFLLMPSLFEPCGLSQLIAMHYGALPIVHKVGGLADTVLEYKKCDSETKKGCGLTFSKENAAAFMKAVNTALELYKNKRTYNKIVQHNMLCDFSWNTSAKSYSELYEKIRQKRDNHE
ncbi:MAG: glycogen synthase [Sulfurimonas sp.]|nr:glycogen synthase [Sulfurimonas sp.]MBU3939020.1 glycogen synthase [bacterium]MBU4024400.1 glycogen synthase [bacterium]MBU4058402.1 glycogen synthase [bacterium]MBU4109927.1 glycogen synthase [bacterium]